MRDTGKKSLENCCEQYTILREYLPKIDRNYPSIVATFKGKEFTTDNIKKTINDHLSGTFFIIFHTISLSTKMISTDGY